MPALSKPDLYDVEFAKLPADKMDSIALKLALIGIGVGALLGPASKRVLEELSQAAKLDVKD